MEDDRVSITALSTILRHHGFAVDVATTVADGTRLLTEKPHWVILDLMLPDGDGVSILKHIRNHNINSRVAITTAVTDPARLNEVRGLSPDLLMKKPLDLSTLLRAMELAN